MKRKIFEAQLADFEAWLRGEQDRSEATVAAYSADVRAFAAWFEQTNGKPLDVRLVTPTDAKDYRAYLTSVARQKASSVNRRLAALRTFFKWAVAQGGLERNPLNGVKTLRQQESAPRWLEARAEYKLQKAIEQRVQGAPSLGDKERRRAFRDAAIVTLMWKAGLRVSEVVALSLDQLEIQSSRRGLARVVDGKGRKSRDVPLNSDVVQALKDWLKVRPPGGSILFPGGRRGQPLTRRAVQDVVERAGRAAAALCKPRSAGERALAESLVALSPHVLRHTCGKRLLDAGAELTEVAAILGHEDLNVTRRYTQPSQADLQRAVERIASAG